MKTMIENFQYNQHLSYMVLTLAVESNFPIFLTMLHNTCVSESRDSSHVLSAKPSIKPQIQVVLIFTNSAAVKQIL